MVEYIFVVMAMICSFLSVAQLCISFYDKGYAAGMAKNKRRTK